VTVVAELPTGAMKPDQAAAVASGLRLRAYQFDRYKTKKKEGEEAALRADVSIAVGDVAAARKAFSPSAHIVEGVITAFTSSTRRRPPACALVARRRIPQKQDVGGFMTRSRAVMTPSTNMRAGEKAFRAAATSPTAIETSARNAASRPPSSWFCSDRIDRRAA